MTKFKCYNYFLQTILILFIFNFNSFSSENRLRAMGDLTWAVPDLNSQINLFQVAKNNAMLINNDSSNWMIYRSESFNNWGKLKRDWDAYRNNFQLISFSGQKHLDNNKIFYGDIRYNWDYRSNVDYAIEKIPYNYDPFVLADYTTGSLMYRGPEVYVAFNHQINQSFFWGICIDYNINRGLKEIASEAEIINRSINASLDLLYKFNEKFSMGFSFAPYQIQDITKLVNLQDGTEPIVRRYRGEFEYRERVGTSDRTADYDGYQLSPQFSFNSKKFKNVTLFGYFYQWHKLYDGTTTRSYDGYFQAQHYNIQSISRINILEKYKSNLFLHFNYELFDDWAKEPILNLLFHQKKDINYRISIGGSTLIPGYTTLAAFELHYNSFKPHHIDYLANIDRNAPIINWLLKIGFENQLEPNIYLRYGINFEKYIEDEIWNYYNSHYGALFTCGFGWKFDDFQLDILGLLRHKIEMEKHHFQRTYLNFSFILKQYLN